MKGKFIVDMEQLSNQDYVLALAKMYKCGSHDYQEWGKEEITPSCIDDEDDKALDWYMVGRNASHEFYLSVDSENQIWRKSYCAYSDIDPELCSYEEYRQLLSSDKQEDWDKAIKAEKWIEEKHVSKVERGSIGYIGHW